MRRPLFGVSAAGYRSEGGFNGPGEPANQWVAWERVGKVPPGRGSGLWHDPERVLDRAAEAGAEAFFICVEWARVEPAPGAHDDEALDRYAAICAMAAERSMVPVAALYDVAHPEWLGEEFWLTPGSPDRFAEHAGRVVSRLGAACTHWVTLRQPNLVALAGWVGGRHPPRRVGALADAWAVADNMLAAHALAHRVVHDAQRDARVLLGLRACASYDWHRLFVDLLCAPSLATPLDALDAWIDARRAQHDTETPVRGLADLAVRRAAARSSAYGARRGPLRVGAPRRAVSLAYESGSSRGRLLDGLLVVWRRPWAGAFAVPETSSLPLPLPLSLPQVRARLGAATPWRARPEPDALRAWCATQARLVPGLPVWIEDGFATSASSGSPAGWDRASYLHAQARALDDAQGAGAPVAGYLYHSVAGGAEPTFPHADFGLFGVDAPASGSHGASGEGRWRDTDATGVDAAGAFRRVVTARRTRPSAT